LLVYPKTDLLLGGGMDTAHPSEKF
jgi:hypothetical protein